MEGGRTSRRPDLGHTYGDALTFVYPYLWSFGAAERDEKGRVIIDGKPALEALEFFKTLWDDAMDPAGVGWDDASNNRAFLSGGLAATRTGRASISPRPIRSSWTTRASR